MGKWRSPMSEGDLNQWRAVPVYVPDLSAIALNGYLLKDFPAPCDGRVLGLTFLTATPATTGGKDIDLAPLVNGVQLTGGLLTLTTAAVDTMGDVVDSTDVTAGDEFSEGDLLSVKCVEAAAAFANGSGTVLLLLGEA